MTGPVDDFLPETSLKPVGFLEGQLERSDLLLESGNLSAIHLSPLKIKKPDYLFR